MQRMSVHHPCSSTEVIIGCYLMILWKNAKMPLELFFTSFHPFSVAIILWHHQTLPFYQLYYQESLFFCWKFQSDHYPLSRWYLVSGRAVQFVARWWSSEASLPLPWESANTRSNLGMAWLVQPVHQQIINNWSIRSTNPSPRLFCDPSHSQSKIVVGQFCNVRHNAAVTLDEGLVWIYLGWTVNISVDFVILSWHNPCYPCYPYPLHPPKLTSMHANSLSPSLKAFRAKRHSQAKPRPLYSP